MVMTIGMAVSFS